MEKKIALITGVSTGLGRAFAEALLQAGYTVVGTVRNQEAAQAFEALATGSAFARIVDVTDGNAITRTVAEVESTIGPIHALINNAGYGHEGTLEESPMEELRHQFEVNFFGAVAMIKAVLPVMRQRRSGRILNITSMGGLMTMPGISYYHASKFALEGLTSSLGKEIKGFGVFATAVEPGMFRTDWAGRSMVRSERRIPDYDAIFDPIRAARASRSGNQPGDPAKAGRAIVQLIESPNPPAHLLLGPDAFDYVSKELDNLRAEFSSWEQVSRSTNFDS
jgi:NAD(P)-dependent dehydrogenase (short-subunit alcohol dehydrogenase family)